MLPPEVEGPNFGTLFIEMQNLEWLTYDGQNYLEEGMTTGGKGVNKLFANIKFWGDRTKGIYLKMMNGMKRGETVTNKFKYDVKCPEKTFEKYLDDMGVLVVDFFDTEKNQTIGTSKIMLKLYIKREKKDNDDHPLLELRGSFPISLTGNQNIKIGQFSISIVSSFALASQDPNQQKMKSRQNINLDDSFEENEKMAQKVSQQDKNKKLIENAFTDDRIPSSYQGQKTNSSYKQNDFIDFEIDEKPTRERPTRGREGQSNIDRLRADKENQRNVINIDENEDTYTNQSEFARIFERGEKLRQQMNLALDADTAWQSLHGQHEVPKRYVPPFLKEEANNKPIDDDELDNIYAIEVEGYKLRESQELKGRNQGDQQDFPKTENTYQRQETQHIRDMKFIKIKINSLRIEDESLLHSLIDETFTISVSVPLPDIYQKKISNQLIKLSNYDIVSFNEFVYNNLSLYNFKIDEETFNQLVQSQLSVSIDGKNVIGSVSMIKLLMSKSYKFEASIPLEQTIIVEEAPKKRNQSQDPKKGGKNVKQDPKKKTKEEIKIQPSSYQKQVGHINIEIQLQRGDTEQELARDYQLKFEKLQEQKAKEESDRNADMQKYLKFSQQQEPVFAQLYIHIQNVRNLSLNQDGSLNKILHEESFMQKFGILNSDREEIKSEEEQNQQNKEQERKAQLIGPKRNLYVQYKAFPALEKLKTNTVWQESTPCFHYRSQFPIIMNPDTVGKLQNFTFVLEVWDVKSPAQEEFIGLVKIPLASFCYSMKTTDDQIFSLNFLADQHCLYPLMISDGYLPIYSPRLGINIGEIQITLAMGTPLQINRQIQKEQDQDKQTLEMTFKSQMVEMMKQKQEDEAKLRLQLEISTKIQQTMQQQQDKTPDLERSVTPDKLQGNLQDQLLSGFNSMMNRPMSPTNQNDGNLFRNIGNYLKQSLNMSITSRDVDMRKITQLNCLRKLFEEARSLDIKDLNGEEIFKDSIKNFDGSVKKEDFLYSLLNKEEFTLTRTEISNIQSLLLNITKNDSTNIDIDEIQFSYKQYLGYYESFQEPIIELLQLFKRNIDKKIEDLEQQDELIRAIEERASESKIPIQELKEILDNQGIFLRDNCYDQLASYFDLDRNDQIYIPSFCEYMRRQSLSRFNFLKVSPNIFTSRINNFVKEQILINPELLGLLENEFKIECFKEQGKIGNLEDIPNDILLTERINAKLFQFKLKKQGTVISLWEVFSFFEHLNLQYAKLYHEPQRYHQIVFSYLYKYVSGGEDYEAKIKAEQERKIKEFEEQQRNLIKASTESVFALAQDLNKQHKRFSNESDGGIYSSKGELFSDEESDVVIEKGNKNKKKEMTFVKKREDDDDIDKRDVSVQLSKARTATLGDYQEDTRPFKKVKHIFEIKVKELKNIPILDKLIKDISRNEQAQNTTTVDRQTQKGKSKNQTQYIQNVAVKYSFPLDDDQVFQSDYIQLDDLSLQQNNQFDYKVSVNTVHNYIINKEDNISSHLKAQSSNQDQLFNLTLAIYEGSKEYVVGNAQLPIEDLIDQIDMYQMNQTNMPDHKQTLSRILFIYGTTFSQRENCIIGKMQIEINYKTEKQYITVDPNNLGSQNQEDFDFDDQVQSSFLHKETYVKRKIPLNGIISVNIESIQNIKESIENIEHFAKIQQSALSQTQDNNQKSSKLTNVSGTSKRSIINQSKEIIDRRRILTQIFKQGLNIAVIGSIFGDDSDLQKKFPQSKHTTKLLYNTLNPIFDDFFNLNVQMDTKLFEYLNNKKAKFEIRHYIIPAKEEVSAGILSKMHVQKEQPSNRSMLSEDQEDANIFESSDYIVIGYVTVPLRNLLASNNGIDDSFVIFDDYKQQMGSLKLRISLNHHSQQRPLYSQETSTKNNNLVQRNTYLTGLRTTMIDRSVKYNQTFARTSSGFNGQAFDNQMIFGINFVELIFKNRENLFNQALVSQQLADQQSYMYLKFKVNGQNYQTKFLSNQTQKQSQYLKQLKLRVFDIKKTVLFQLDLLNQQEMEDMFGKPLEIQLWYKKEAVQRHKQPDQEELIGSFFIELNDLGKIKNKRIKDQGEQTQYQAYEGYFSLYDYQKEQVQCDRLGCKVFLMRKGMNQLLISQIFLEYETQLADAEVLFHNLNGIEQQIQSVLDPNQKGFVDYEDLVALISKDLQDPYLSMLKQLVDQLQYKNSEKVFYSPLFGQLPPYFRLMKKFDSFGVIDKFNKEFNQLDNQSTGYLPLPIFRSLLEHELKIKEKIVVDFIQGLREVDAQQNLQSLDVNLFSHSLKNQIDYVVLLRKIAQYFDVKNQEKHSSNESQFQDTQMEQDGEVILKIDIESAMRLKNPLSELEPPNSQVVLKLPFLHSKSNQIQTQVVQKSSYPAWHLVGQQIKFQLSQENLKAIIESPLEFEVYHHYLANRDQSSKHLIGVAYLDLSLMVFVDGIFQMSGYFHILNKDKYKDGHAIPLTNTVELQNNSLGQLKLNIQTTSNLKQMAYSNNIQRTLVKENSPIKDKRGGETINDAGYQSYYPNQMTTMSFNRDTNLNVFQQQPTAVLSETHQKLQYSFNRFNLDLNEQQEEDLKIKHTQNMSELDKLLSTLKSGKLEDEVPDNKFEKIVRNNLQTRVDQQSSKNSQPPVYDYGVENNLKVTHGYNQSQHLIQQLNKFTQSVRDNDRIQQLQRDAVKAAVQEQEYEGSEFDRDEELKNDFDHHQPSYNVFEQHNNLRSQQIESHQDQEEDQLEDEIIQHNQAQNQVLYFEQDPLKQSFSPLNFPIGQTLQQYQQVLQTLPHQTNQPIVPPLNITNVFERMNLNAHIESDSEDRQNYGMNNDEDNHNSQVIDERVSASFNQQLMNQQKIQEEPVRDSAPATETKKKSIYQIMDEDDDEMDPIEMARLQKILGSKQK